MANVDLTEELDEIKRCTKQEPCDCSFSPTSMTDAPGICPKRDYFNPREMGCQKPRGCGCRNVQVHKGATNVCDNESTCPFRSAPDNVADTDMFGQFYDVGTAVTFGNQVEDFEGDIGRILTLLKELKDLLTTDNCFGGRNFGPQALELIKCIEHLVNGNSFAKGSDDLMRNFSLEMLSEDGEECGGNKACNELNARFKNMICKLYSEFEPLEDEMKEKAISDLEKVHEALMSCEPIKEEVEDLPYNEDEKRGQQEGALNSDPDECQDETRENEQTGEIADTDPTDRGTHNTAQYPSVDDDEGNVNNLKDHLVTSPAEKEEKVLDVDSNKPVMESLGNFLPTADIRERITSLLCIRDNLTSAEFDGKLLSMLCDLDDIIDTYESRLTNSGQLPPSNQQDCQNSIKPTATLFWVVSCLENYIRHIKPNLRFPECNLDSKICGLLCVFSYLLQSQLSDLSNLGMAEEALKCLNIELSRQGTRASVLAAYAHQLEEMVTNARTVKADTKTEENDESGPNNSVELGSANQTQHGEPIDEDVGKEAQNASLSAYTTENLVGNSPTSSSVAGEVKCKVPVTF
ncbi:hypothetical protein TcWFU_000140 [Taenia crassiceps]|uniref:Uncharacterized protein n=1 Tax=Taenia crassiceps TaxID=6207 RepID=A0ABR4Q7V6_9CEST